MGFLKDIQVDLNAEAMTLYNECHDSLLVEAVDLCKDAHAAEDLVMRTFEEFCKNRDKYDPEKGSWFQWLKGIMRNIHHNASRGKAISCMVYMSPEELALVQDSSESETGAIDAVLANSDAEVVRRAINGLSKEMREVILLKYFEDLPIAQIAKILNASEDSIKCRLYYARKILAKRLGKQLGKKPVAIVVALLLSIASAFGAWKAADALGWLPESEEPQVVEMPSSTATVDENTVRSAPSRPRTDDSPQSSEQDPNSSANVTRASAATDTTISQENKGSTGMSLKTVKTMAAVACEDGDRVRVNGSEPVASTNFSAEAGSFVELTPVPSEGRSFVRWRGDVGPASSLAPDGRIVLKVSRPLTVGLVSAEGDFASSFSAFDYVTDGLVALWDGADNANYGVHDASATSWRQLVDGSPHDDLRPNEKIGSDYSWSDTALNVTSATGGAVFTNSYCSVLACVEANLKFGANGFVISAQAMNDNDHRLIGYWNMLYITGMNNAYGFTWTFDSKAYHTFSADYSVYTTETPYLCYADGVSCTKKGTVGYGGKTMKTAIGNWSASYGVPKPSFRSIRYYGQALSADQRAYNLTVDQIRFNGVSSESAFDDQPNAPVAIVRASSSGRSGVASPAYGVHPYRGQVGQTFSLSGYEVQADGTRIIAQGEGARAKFLGYSLQVGDGEPTEDADDSVSVPSLAGRTTLTWRLVEQRLVQVACTGGDAVRVNGSDPVAATNFWADVGSALSLEPVPSAGRRFRRWTGEVGGAASRAPDGRIVLPVASPRAVELVTEKDEGACVFHTGDYSEENLVALWDGTENAGVEQHDPQATSWKQLVPGTVHGDLLPDATMGSDYSWSANSLDITSKTEWARFTNDCCEALGTIELNVKVKDKGWVLSGFSPADTTHYLLGYVGTAYYIRGNNGTSCYSFSPGYTAYHTVSADYKDFLLYADNVERTTCGTASYGTSGNRTQIGNWYKTAQPSFRSIRYYKQPVSKVQRDLNYAVDRVRFEGEAAETAFADKPDVPVVLVLGEPTQFGTAVPSYGAHTVKGAVSQTFTLSGTKAYSDRVTAIPGTDDAEGRRARLLGYTLQRGDGEAVSGEGASVFVEDITNRTTLVWRFADQCRLKVSANDGGTVSVDGGTQGEIWYDSVDDTEVKLSATPEAGFLFSTWVGDTNCLADARAATVTVRMSQACQLEARFVRERHLSSESYVADGLVAQWDGRENAGRGIHSATTNRWVELSQGRPSASSSNGPFIWSENGPLLTKSPSQRVSFPSSPWMYGLAQQIAEGGGMTWEVPYTLTSESNGSLIYTAGGQQCMNMRFVNNTDVKRVRFFNTSVSGNVNGEIYYGWADSSVDAQGTATAVASGNVGRYYQNGMHATSSDKVFAGTLASESSYGTTYMGDGLTGTVHAVRIYGRALSEHEILWNNAVDRARYFRDFGDTNEMLRVLTPYGTSTPAAGTYQLPAGIDVEFSIADSLYDYEDGARAVFLSHTRRARYDGWTSTSGGPRITKESGTDASLTLMLTNLCTTFEWKMTPQAMVTAAAVAGPDGALHGAVNVQRSSGAEAADWVDEGKPLTLVALPDAGWRVSSWSTNGVPLPGRRRLLTLPVNGPFGATVTFELAPGIAIIVR